MIGLWDTNEELEKRDPTLTDPLIRKVVVDMYKNRNQMLQTAVNLFELKEPYYSQVASQRIDAIGVLFKILDEELDFRHKHTDDFEGTLWMASIKEIDFICDLARIVYKELTGNTVKEAQIERARTKIDRLSHYNRTLKNTFNKKMDSLTI